MYEVFSFKHGMIMVVTILYSWVSFPWAYDSIRGREDSRNPTLLDLMFDKTLTDHDETEIA